MGCSDIILVTSIELRFVFKVNDGILTKSGIRNKIQSEKMSLLARISQTLPYTGSIGLVCGFFFSVAEGMVNPKKSPREIPLDVCAGGLVGLTWPVSIPLIGSYGIYRRITAK